MTDPLTRWLNEMERKARAATPGPWRIPGANIGRIVAPEAPHTNPMEGKCPPYPWAIVADTDSRSVPEWHHNAAYIAALDPATIQALLDVAWAASVPAIQDALAQASERHDQNGSQFHATALALEKVLARLRAVAERSKE